MPHHSTHTDAPLVRSFISFPCIRRTGLEDELCDAAEDKAIYQLGEDYTGPVIVRRVWIEDHSDDGCIAACGAEIWAARGIEEREGV